MNSIPKYVASRTLEEPLDWNASLIKGDLAGELWRQTGHRVDTAEIVRLLTDTVLRPASLDSKG